MNRKNPTTWTDDILEKLNSIPRPNGPTKKVLYAEKQNST
jgi:tRNA U34 5-methylaminomethyl-2-thiouridine-forming methyltransferase MnmC